MQTTAATKVVEPPLLVHTRPVWTTVLLVASDVLSLMVAMGAAMLTAWLLERPVPKVLYWQIWPATLVFVVSYALFKLYPGVAMTAADELRRLSIATTLTFLVLWSVVYFVTTGQGYARAVLLIAWIQSLLSVPLGRTLVRALFSHLPWWGFPVLVLGTRRTAMRVVHAMQQQPQWGLKVAYVLLDKPERADQIEGVPVAGHLNDAPRLGRKLGITHAVVALPSTLRERMPDLVGRFSDVFPNLLVVPERVGYANLRAVVRDMAGISGLEIRHRLLMTGPKVLKRGLDLLSIALSLPVLLPLVGLIALMIKIDSRGPVFYSQTRIGRDGRPFRAWKFRSMVTNADEVLEAYLKEHEELRRQWEHKHKLTPDPRVTRMGQLLRKTSLDELPQIWNVVRGEMSLVGPRPIVDAEVDRYRKIFSLYVKVTPGLTGLWQVSGRNDTTYRERVCLDAYYVRNWSVWLDLYILMRTVGVVARGRGAY